MEPPTAATRGRSGPIVIGGVIVGGLLVTLLATAPWRSESVPADFAWRHRTRTTRARRRGTEGRGDGSDDAARRPRPLRRAITPAPAAPPPTLKAPPARTAPSKPPEVAAAQLCETLSTSGDWRCVAPTLPVNPGPVYFYSRVKSADRYDRAASVVPRRPPAPGGVAPHQREPQRRLPHLQPADRRQSRVRRTGGSNSGRATGSCCTRSASSFVDRQPRTESHGRGSVSELRPDSV